MCASAHASYSGAGHLKSGDYGHRTLQLSHLHTAYFSFLTPQKIGACVFVAPPHHHIGVTARPVSVPPSLPSWVKCVFRFGTMGASSSKVAMSSFGVATGMSAGTSSNHIHPPSSCLTYHQAAVSDVMAPGTLFMKIAWLHGLSSPKKLNKTHTILHMSYVCACACKYYMPVTCLTHSGSVSLFELWQRWNILLTVINYIFISLCFVPVLDLQNIVMNTMWADI